MRHTFLSVLTLLAVTLLITPMSHPSEDKQQKPEENRGTQVVLLGTGTPNADPERSGPAVAIVVNGSPYLIDCGPGVVRRAAAAALKGVAGLTVTRLNRLFITHLHSDHTLGYADVILSPWTLGRADPLEVYGPKGLKSMTQHLLAAYREDIQVRTGGLEPANKTGYRVKSHEIVPGQIYIDANVTVSAFAVNHASWPLAFGYRFQTPDRNIVISGDTTPSQSIIDNCHGCDVLIHEVYSQQGFLRRPPEWQRYHSASHTSTIELAEIANKAKPGLLILYHQLFWGTTEQDLLEELRQHYKGRVVSGHDLDIF
ncbi:MAG: MBL fold metallo-hydrolase [Acidobacteriota bacterium]|jgi:ribonuclease BN (tRNA processing enzyme)